MGTKDARIDGYIAAAQPFARPILTFIRKAVHAGCPGIEETLKWRHPAFMYKGILCGTAAFKEHVTFGFWKASAMNGVGGKAADAAGQFGRITAVRDLPDRKTLIRLVKEAAALHDAGVKAPRMKGAPKRPLKEPDYFTAALKKNRKALAAYRSVQSEPQARIPRVDSRRQGRSHAPAAPGHGDRVDRTGQTPELEVHVIGLVPAAD